MQTGRFLELLVNMLAAQARVAAKTTISDMK